MSCPNEKISFFCRSEQISFRRSFHGIMQISSPLCKLARQDTTTFVFRPIPENISFLWKTLTPELKLKRFYPIIKMTTLKDLGTYLMTLKLDDSGCRIYSISNDDGNKEIVTNERYVVMPWKMVARYGKNMTLKEAVEEIEKEGEERWLVSKFEAEHRDEILEILGLIDYVDKGYVEESFRGHSQLDYFKKTFGAYRGLDMCI